MPNCSQCVLRTHKVPGLDSRNMGPGIQILIVTSEPSPYETSLFSSQESIFILEMLQSHGQDLSRVGVFSAVACAHPAGYSVAEWTSRKSKLSTPLANCQDRRDSMKVQLMGKKFPNLQGIITIGKHAAEMFRGSISMDDYRGSVCYWDNIPVGITEFPRTPAYRPVIQRDIRQFLALFRGEREFQPGEKPTLIPMELPPYLVQAAFTAILETPGPIYYDYETNIAPRGERRPYCLGLATEDPTVTVAIAYSVDRFDLFKDFFQKASGRLIAHNGTGFDMTVTEDFFGVHAEQQADTLQEARLAFSDFQQINLGFVASYLTDNLEAWKSDFKNTTVQGEADILLYCAKDADNLRPIHKRLIHIIKERKQEEVCKKDYALMAVGRSMEKLGVLVDRAKVDAAAMGLVPVISDAVNACPLNPFSTNQVASLLYEDWALPVVETSLKTGAPSCGDNALRKLYLFHTSPEQQAVIKLIQKVRKLCKLQDKLQELLDSSSRTGRIHVQYTRLPVTSRYSAIPNIQNIMSRMGGFSELVLKNFLLPDPGYVLVCSDADQLELRRIAEISRATKLIEEFNTGLDAHNETMEFIFGPGIWQLPGAPNDRKKKGDGVFKETRDGLKNVRYAWIYKAAADAILSQIQRIQDKKGAYTYGKMLLRTVQQMCRGMAKRDYEIVRWWETTINHCVAHGWVDDEIWGRRRYFPTISSPNEVVNFPIQSGGTSIVHDAMFELLGMDVPLATTAQNPGNIVDLGGQMLIQEHDELVFQVPERHADEALAIVAGTMTRKTQAGLLWYTCGPKIKDKWE